MSPGGERGTAQNYSLELYGIVNPVAIKRYPMKRFFRLLNYLFPYKWYVVQNVVYNILGAFFALFSFAMVIPFLKVLFDNQDLVTEPMEFELSTDYFMHTLNYYMGKIMADQG